MSPGAAHRAPIQAGHRFSFAWLLFCRKSCYLVSQNPNTISLSATQIGCGRSRVALRIPASSPLVSHVHKRNYGAAWGTDTAATDGLLEQQQQLHLIRFESAAAQQAAGCHRQYSTAQSASYTWRHRNDLPLRQAEDTGCRPSSSNTLTDR